MNETENGPVQDAGGEAHAIKRFKVAIRRDLRAVRPNAEQLEGKTYVFTYGWVMDKNDPYPGEIAYLPHDPSYPVDAPCWVASGDLVFQSLVSFDARDPQHAYRRTTR